MRRLQRKPPQPCRSGGGQNRGKKRSGFQRHLHQLGLILIWLHSGELLALLLIDRWTIRAGTWEALIGEEIGCVLPILAGVYALLSVRHEKWNRLLAPLTAINCTVFAFLVTGAFLKIS